MPTYRNPNDVTFARAVIAEAERRRLADEAEVTELMRCFWCGAPFNQHDGDACDLYCSPECDAAATADSLEDL